MPAKSKKQQMAAGAALSAKRGRRPKSSLRGASKQMVESMSEGQLEEFAHTKRKKLPKRASSSKKRSSKKSKSGRKKSSRSKR
jgi:hypothetical protein